jgi:hypothetical protein
LTWRPSTLTHPLTLLREEGRYGRRPAVALAADIEAEGIEHVTNAMFRLAAARRAA